MAILRDSFEAERQYMDLGGLLATNRARKATDKPVSRSHPTTINAHLAQVQVQKTRCTCVLMPWEKVNSNFLGSQAARHALVSVKFCTLLFFFACGTGLSPTFGHVIAPCSATSTRFFLPDTRTCKLPCKIAFRAKVCRYDGLVM